MKAVLISIRPEWCELIASGKKTVEVRKTRPKLETPFKCYIYCTKEHTADDRLWIFAKKAREQFGTSVNIAHLCGAKDVGGAYKGNGKVIGEFVCDNIDRYTDEVVNSSWLENFCGWNDFDLNRACIHPDDLEEYAGGKDLYGWHISDLVIYDKPKGLNEFYKKCETLPCEGCEHLKWMRANADEYEYDCDCMERLPITRPPQSWCYVEEV